MTRVLTSTVRFGSVRCRLELKWADLWVGAYWDRRGTRWDAWVCVLPCLPIHLWRGGVTDG